ncbi:MAG: VanZ family protein, partial [Lysobacter sp.]|nr:VanZ family protein [Lysobacter sp.]
DRADAFANTLGVILGLATQLTPWRDLLLRLDGGARRESPR